MTATEIYHSCDALIPYCAFQIGRVRRLQEADKEDCLQECRLAAWKAARRYKRAKGEATTFLGKTARFVALGFVRGDRLRALRRHVGLADLHELFDPPAPEQPERVEMPADVAAALRGLPPRYKFCLEKHVMHGWTYDRLAGYLGVSRERVRQLVLGALKRLRRRLGVT